MRKSVLITLGLAAAIAATGAAAVLAGMRPSVSDCVEPSPAGEFETFRTRAADGNCLQGYVWTPDATPVRAALVVVHGIHDHARRYAALAQALNARGIAVVAQDHRGHAASGGTAQRVDSVAQLLGDVDLALQEAGRRFPGVPLFLHGHSMGGMVAAHRALPDRQPPLAGVVISSAALALPASASAGQLRVLRALSAVAPGLPVEAIDEALVVREPAARAALATDPLIARHKVPARTVATVLAGIESIQPRMHEIDLPLLVLHGGQDRITEVEGSRTLHARAGSSQKSLRLFDSALHDLLHEPEAAQVRQAIGDFVEARISSTR